MGHSTGMNREHVISSEKKMEITSNSCGCSCYCQFLLPSRGFL